MSLSFFNFNSAKEESRQLQLNSCNNDQETVSTVLLGLILITIRKIYSGMDCQLRELFWFTWNISAQLSFLCDFDRNIAFLKLITNVTSYKRNIKNSGVLESSFHLSGRD